MEKIEKKVITREYNSTVLAQYPSVNFEVNRYDAAIIQKGYNVIHHRALKCPCTNRETHSPLPNCQNCSGFGWFYIDKKETKALVQNMGNAKKQDTWSETNAGQAYITTMWVDDVTYMDKFEISDLESNFSQILFMQSYNGVLFAFTIYEPTKVMNIYAFKDSNSALLPLYSIDEKPSNWDYFIDKNKIVFNADKFPSKDVTVTVRYKHTPVYCVVDILRELFKTKDAKCSELCNEEDGISLKGAPQKSLGKRLHYIWNANDLAGIKEYDNTDYTKIKQTTLENNVIQEQDII